MKTKREKKNTDQLKPNSKGLKTLKEQGEQQSNEKEKEKRKKEKEKRKRKKKKEIKK